MDFGRKTPTLNKSITLEDKAHNRVIEFQAARKIKNYSAALNQIIIEHQARDDEYRYRELFIQLSDIITELITEHGVMPEILIARVKSIAQVESE